MINFVTTTPTRFAVIRPELLPPMQVLESISTEDIISARIAKMVQIWNDNDPPNAAQYDVGNLEFDPLRIQAELAAYFELLVRDRVNQACRAVTLAFAVGSDLDAIGSRYPYGVPRFTTAAGTWTGPGTQETDDAYRQRIWLSPNLFSIAQTGQAVFESYCFFALSAPMPIGEQPLKHATAMTQRGTGIVYLTILSSAVLNTTWIISPDKTVWSLVPGLHPVPTAAQIAAVYEYITEPNTARMGLTDVLQVNGPQQVTNIAIDYGITLFPGVDALTLMGEVAAAVLAVVQAINWLGADLTLLSLDGACAQAGVYNVTRNSPMTDQIVAINQVVNVTSIKLTYLGIGE